MRIILLGVFVFYSVAFAAGFEEDKGATVLGVNQTQSSLKDTSLLESEGDPISAIPPLQTCKRERIVILEVIPEIRKQNPRFCLGHWNRWGTSKSHCGGCRGGDEYVERSKEVRVLRDEWVGCELEESLRHDGLAELEELRSGPSELLRIIQGEPVSGDIWEETRVYRVERTTFDQVYALEKAKEEQPNK